MSERTFGTVKWFSRAKGYGFIQPDGSAEDVFVHYTAIVGEGFRNLKRGQRVQFNIEDTAKGPQAVAVTEMESAEESAPEVAQTSDMPKESAEESAPEVAQTSDMPKESAEESTPEVAQTSDMSKESAEESTPEVAQTSDMSESESASEALDTSTTGS